MDEETRKESNTINHNVDCSSDSVRIISVEDIFAKEECHDFQIVKISSSDDSNDGDNDITDRIDIGNDVANRNDIINIEDNDNHNLSHEDNCPLELNVWPVNVDLETDGHSIDSNGDHSIDLNSETGVDDDDEDDSCRDADENCSSNSDLNDNTKRRKKKKLSKVRKKKKRSFFYVCKDCDCKFYSEFELKIHAYSTHTLNNNLNVNNNEFKCLVCNKIFYVKCYLDAHITKAHTEKKVINCIKCNKVFKYRSYLTRNSTCKKSAGVIENRQFTCFHCNLNRF